MTDVLGIDPSQRHTGLCLLRPGQSPVFHEISTDGIKGLPRLDILSSAQYIRQELLKFLMTWNLQDPIFSVEKMYARGLTGPLSFYIQMEILETIEDWWYSRLPISRIQIVWPLPVQLKSYMKRKHGILTGEKREIIKACQREMGLIVGKPVDKMSSHKADAFFLANLGRDVLNNSWTYKPPKKELLVLPQTEWEIIYGVCTGNPQAT